MVMIFVPVYYIIRVLFRFLLLVCLLLTSTVLPTMAFFFMYAYWCFSQGC